MLSYLRGVWRGWYPNNSQRQSSHRPRQKVPVSNDGATKIQVTTIEYCWFFFFFEPVCATASKILSWSNLSVSWFSPRWWPVEQQTVQQHGLRLLSQIPTLPASGYAAFFEGHAFPDCLTRHHWSASFTLVLVIIHCFFDYQNRQNPVDRAFIKFMRPKSWNTQQRRPPEKWTQALEAAIVIYSNTQVLIGLQFVSVHFCSSSAESQYITGILDLSWFSSLTHFTTLKSLRCFFRKRAKLAFWRVFSMGANLVLLLVAIAPTGHISTPSRADLAWCLFTEYLWYQTPSSTFNMPLIVLTFLFLLTNYITRVMLSKLARKWLRVIPGDLMKTAIQTQMAVSEMNQFMLWEVCILTTIEF